LTEPWDITYRPYQIGFFQDRHNALTSEVNLLIRFFHLDKFLKKSFQVKIDQLKKHKIISKKLYNDLDKINRARNKFVKSSSQPHEDEIKELLYNIESIKPDKENLSKYSLYRLLLISIQRVHLRVTDSPSYKKYFISLFGKAV